MEKYGVNELRSMFTSFFESKDHLKMHSFPLVPIGDKSLLLINSGMAPLKPYFTGAEVPPRKRVATSQKCIRTGDIENVGKTARHGTFFEMLGNFSFGDYFKKEAIAWAWEFCLQTLKMPVDRLYVSVYHEDDEALQIWNEQEGVPVERIYKMGKADNFWEVGLGPCGPCSEIYFDRGESYGCDSPSCDVGCDCDRYIEFWNLVFTQFNKEEDGSYSNLPNPNIDTGMGLERLAVIMQDVGSIYDIDAMKAIRDKICEVSGKSYGRSVSDDVSIRVITDHVRSVTFMTADGVLPSSEGRGYVMRRLLRRAVRHGQLLGVTKSFLSDVAQVVIDNFCGEYPELGEKAQLIGNIIKLEEQRFRDTIGQGLELLKAQVGKLRESGGTTLDGAAAFKLYDTFGFPLELVLEILAEDGLDVDKSGFDMHMQAQRERARAAREESTFMGTDESAFDKLESVPPTVFEGYAEVVVNGAQILAMTVDGNLADEAGKDAAVAIILDRTPFYAESGGQVGDVGVIRTSDALVRVSDTQKVPGGRTAHIGVVEEGRVKVGGSVSAEVDASARMATSRNHSATHLLHRALKDVVGNHVEQAGSLVAPGRLRFDFTHFSSLSAAELQDVESRVNANILAALPVTAFETGLDEARALGAVAFFGEKYGDTVRVVKMGDYAELCGGVHCGNTGQIGLIKILSEASVASGVRRVEAVTGLGVLALLNDSEDRLAEVSAVLKTTPSNLVKSVEQIVQSNKENLRQLEQMRGKAQASYLEDGGLDVEEAGGFAIITGCVDGMDGDALKELGDRAKDRYKSSVIALVGVQEDKATMIVMATDDAVASGVRAGDVVKDAIALLDGRGGGKPSMAMAGGKDNGRIAEAIALAKTKILSSLTS
ncbi:MAG: alanine--tRNA ligase [Defluviitaleaceae bacterium]|nr:alanine--tRNA ligase [Defluviitaleaceae bacterium]